MASNTKAIIWFRQDLRLKDNPALPMPLLSEKFYQYTYLMKKITPIFHLAAPAAGGYTTVFGLLIKVLTELCVLFKVIQSR